MGHGVGTSASSYTTDVRPAEVNQPDALMTVRRTGHDYRQRSSESGEPAGPGPGRTQRLVVVSNRVPVPTGRAAAGAGGLAVALDAALKEHGGMWFGWSGEARAAIDADAVSVNRVGRITFAVTDLTKRDVDDYYLGFSNRALWPVCHYRLDLARFSSRESAAYLRVNDLLARKLTRLLEPGDLIWVHDYHLIPLGQSLRERGVEDRIGFFLHIPWPPSEIASALPGYRQILASMTAYDLVGFQTERDADNFGRCLVEERIANDVGDGWFEGQGRRFRIGAFPIGIDTEGFAKVAEKAVALPAVKRMVATMAERKLVIGVDRLDYSKGILERIRAFCAYLGAHREEKARVTYLQVTPKSRSDVPEYKQMQREVAAQVGEANGAYGDIDFTPIRYLNQNIAHTTLAGLYRMAGVGLVTPLRDGMNLVAKEYVASQSPDDPGVLVLSRYAGAAAELHGAIVVNPFDATETASAIDRALTMSLGERKERWGGMMRHLRANTVGDWWRGFIAELAPASGEASGSATARTSIRA